MSKDDEVAFKRRLDAVSPSFCLAKWNQVTLHLQNGHTHSCHHPPTHKVPLAELEADPSALHNTSHKKERRREMLGGTRPSECDYCWRIEDTGAISDRVLKSMSSWAAGDLESTSKLAWDANVDPTYVEVSFSNTCNFKCSYCGPTDSSMWRSEISEHGPYPTTNKFNDLKRIEAEGRLPYQVRDKNPYVDAFWEWWPAMRGKLQHFRITGGEPLLNKNTFRVLEDLIENPAPDLELSINSNMCVPADKMVQFLLLVERMEGKVKKLKIFTSCEARGPRGEYARHGLKYDTWLLNVRAFLSDCSHVAFTVMSTYNVFSVTSYSEFLKDCLELRAEFPRPDGRCPLLVDIPYLRHPQFLAADIVTPDMLHYLRDSIHMMRMFEVPHGESHRGFLREETDKLKRIEGMIQAKMREEPDEDFRAHVERSDFRSFVDEHDRRRGTDFCRTFPEMEEFYHFCGTR